MMRLCSWIICVVKVITGYTRASTCGTYLGAWWDALGCLFRFICCLFLLRGLFLISLLAVIPVIDRIIPTIPIEVRVATGGVYRVALQPARRAGGTFL